MAERGRLVVVSPVPRAEEQGSDGAKLRKLLQARVAQADPPLLRLLLQTVRCSDRLRAERGAVG
jgi:hypothetical protein